MKKTWMKRISIVLAALLLLAVLPISVMAEKESKTGTGAKATASNASKEVATASDAYEGGELLDGEVHDDLPPVEEEEAALNEDITPAEPEAVPETTLEAVPAEVPEKAAETAEADITGFWTLDGTTNYRFEENGIGALVLPEHEFPFSYTAEEEELTLLFDDSSSKPVVFTFTLEDDTLILRREEAAGTSEFILEKTAD